MDPSPATKAAMIAPCGMSCGTCYAYLREKNHCLGCRGTDERKPTYCVQCIIADCPHFRETKAKHCSTKCADFPCKRLRALDKRYRTGDFVLRECKDRKPAAKGRASRSCVEELVGHAWWTSNGAVYERKIGGVWKAVGGYGVGDPVNSNGILSEVTAEAARYRGREIWIDVSHHQMPVRCKDGSYHRCPAPPSVEAEERGTDHFFGVMLPRGAATCTEPCPPVSDGGIDERIRELNDLDPWRVAPAREPFAGIYRSAGACQKDAARFRELPSYHGER